MPKDSTLLKNTALVAVPRTVWMLGFVSLFMDISSELIHSLIPVFLVTNLSASALTVGIIEGIAEATALIVKIFSGAISDYLGRRKVLLLLGYGLAALTKPLFPLAASAEVVFTARFLDRIGKGIRGAPRDALIADVAPAEIRGACFGLRQSMDTVGAFIGPLLAILLLWLYANDLKTVLWFSVIPAVVAVLLILLGIEDPEREIKTSQFRSPIRLSALRVFSRRYWWIVIVGAIFTLARFSEAFLVLRAQQTGVSLGWIPLVMVVMSVAYSISAYPAGALADRMRKEWLLAIGLGFLILADLLLAQSATLLHILCGVILWGLHMGFSQGVLATMIAESAPKDLKGTAFGIFNLVSGLFMLISSVLAGWLWVQLGAEMTFYAGAGFSIMALGLVSMKR